MRLLRSVFAAATAVALLALLSACAPRQAAGPALHPNLVIVREFSVSPGVVTLDPSFGFSLHRGAPGVPPRQRADSVARAAAFNLADQTAQRLAALGYDAIRSGATGPEPSGRALIVTGAFRHIYEGRRHRGAGVAADVEIDYEAAGAAPQRLTAFSLDSRQLPSEPVADVSLRQGDDLNAVTAQLGAVIARYVGDLARLNRWPGAAR